MTKKAAREILQGLFWTALVVLTVLFYRSSSEFIYQRF